MGSQHSAYKQLKTMRNRKLLERVCLVVGCLLAAAYVFVAVVLTAIFQRYKAEMPALAEDHVAYSVAHRGCHIDGLVPENCPAGVTYAWKYGYRAVECDVHYTKDSVMVLMHDATINRTMRLREGYAEIAEPVRVADLTYEELCERYVLASSDTALRTSIPTLEEELTECRRLGIVPMLHTNLTEAFDMAQRMMRNHWIAFDADYEAMKTARRYNNDLVLWDPGSRSVDEIIPMLEEIGKPCGVSSMKVGLLTEEFCRKLTSEGYEVQSSIFPTPHEMGAIRNGASIVLSDFCLVDHDHHGSRVGMLMQRDAQLGAGDSLSLTSGASVDGSLQLEMELEGRVEIVVNGERRYEISGLQGERWRNGWRHHDVEQPTLVVRALEPTHISRLKAECREY